MPIRDGKEDGFLSNVDGISDDMVSTSYACGTRENKEKKCLLVTVFKIEPNWQKKNAKAKKNQLKKLKKQKIKKSIDLVQFFILIFKIELNRIELKCMSHNT